MNNHKPNIHSKSNLRLSGDSWFLLCVLLLGLGTFALLPRLATVLVSPSNAAAAGKPSNGMARGNTTTPTPPTTFQVAHAHLYPFPSSNLGLMQPAMDAQGNLWVGEMYANRLARLNTHTGVVTSWMPPHAQNGIMSTAIDAQGHVWFVEQGADYLGEFDPTVQTFRIFPLGTLQGRPLGPQNLAFDASGQLWFSAPSGGGIGRLDPKTGSIRTWQMPPPAVDVPSTPFSLTVTKQGQVWFGDLTGGVIGSLDATTGRMKLFHLANSQAQVFSMSSDSQGRVWFTELLPGQLGMIDPVTGQVREWPVPAVSNNPAALYALVVTAQNEVWFVDNSADALVRYKPTQAGYTFFQFASSASAPYGLTLAPTTPTAQTGSLWFTVTGSSTNAAGTIPLQT